ncbi:hypothetical protein KA183_00525 [bacterium]|nr:hypothetical protein [bacterium]
MAGETDKPVEDLKASVADTAQPDTAVTDKFLTDARAQISASPDVTATANQLVSDLERSGLLPYVALSRMNQEAKGGPVDLNAFRANAADQLAAPGVDVKANPVKALDRALLAALDRNPQLLAELKARGNGDVFQSGDVTAQIRAFRESAAQRARTDGATDPKFKIAAALLDKIPGTDRTVIDKMGGYVDQNNLRMALHSSNPHKLSPEQLSSLKTLQQNWRGTSGVNDLGNGYQINKQSLIKAVGADSPEAAVRKLEQFVPDSQYQETRTTSGAVRTFKDGRTITYGNDGKLTTQYSDTWKGEPANLKGAKVEVFPPGTRDQIKGLLPANYPLVNKEFDQGATVTTRMVDGKSVVTIKNPSDAKRYPNAETTIQNGEVTTVFNDKSIRTVKSDGTIVREAKDAISVTKPNGDETKYIRGAATPPSTERPVTSFTFTPKGGTARTYTAEAPVNGVTKFKGPDGKIQPQENLRLRPDGTLMFNQKDLQGRDQALMVKPTRDGTPEPATPETVLGGWRPRGQDRILKRNTDPADKSELILGRKDGKVDTIGMTGPDGKPTDGFKLNADGTWNRVFPANRQQKVELTFSEQTGAMTLKEAVGDNTVTTNIKPDGTRVVTELTSKDGRSFKVDPKGDMTVTMPGKSPETFRLQTDNSYIRSTDGKVFKSVALDPSGRFTTVDNNGLKTEITPKGVQRPLESVLPNDGGKVTYSYANDSANVPNKAVRTFKVNGSDVTETLSPNSQGKWERTRSDQPGTKESIRDVQFGLTGNLQYRDTAGDVRTWGDAAAPAIVGKPVITRADSSPNSEIRQIVNGDKSVTAVGYSTPVGGELPKVDTIVRNGPNGERQETFTKSGDKWSLIQNGQTREVKDVVVDQKTGNITYTDGTLNRVINTNGQNEVTGITYPNGTVAKVDYDARGVAQTLTLTDKAGKATVYRGNEFKMEPATGAWTNPKTGQRFTPDGNVTTPDGVIRNDKGDVLGSVAPGRNVEIKRGADGTLSTITANNGTETTTITKNERSQWVIQQGARPERLITEPNVDAAGNVTWNEGGKPFTMKPDGTITDGTVAAVKPDGPAVAIPGIDKSGIGKYGPHGVAEAVLGRQTTPEGQFAINELKNILRDANGGTKAIMGLKAGTPLINESNKASIVTALKATLAKKANPQLQALLNQLGG